MAGFNGDTMKRTLFVLSTITLTFAGCTSGIGSGTLYERDKTTITNGSPVTLNIQDADKIGTAVGTGPARYTSLNDKGLQTLQTGTVPRDAVLHMPDGSKFVLSSGTDLNIEGVSFDPESKKVSIGKLSTVTSEPIRAGNEAYDRLAAVWINLNNAQKEAVLAQVEAIRVTSPEIASLILRAIGVP